MRTNRRGSVAVLAAILLSFVLIVGVLPMLDMGRIRTIKIQAQAAADAVALAGASGLITGWEDSVWTRAQEIAALNVVNGLPAHIDTLIYNTETGKVVVWIGADTGPLTICGFLAPLVKACSRETGIRVRMSAGARAEQTDSTTAGRGTPIPRGNAFGWLNNEKKHPGKDSAVVRLFQ